MSEEISYREFRDNLADVLNRIEYRAEEFVLTRRGKPVADITPHAENTITLDLANPDTDFVLTDALREWAARQRHEAGNELADDPEDATAHARLRWAEAADVLLGRIESA